MTHGIPNAIQMIYDYTWNEWIWNDIGTPTIYVMDKSLDMYSIYTTLYLNKTYHIYDRTDTYYNIICYFKWCSNV